VLARALEEEGLSTVSIVLIRDHAERAKPPRALFAPFPLGFALGKPNDPPFQHRVLAAAFSLLEAERGPVLVDFDEESDAPVEVLAASRVEPDRATIAAAGDPADEVTQLRGYYERWLEENDGRTMVGLTGVPQRRWRGLIRFLEAVAAGEEATYRDRPPDVPLARFLRYAADDLKAFYFEARMARRPDQRDNDLHRWFWSETAMGRLLVRVSERMAASEDAELVQHARHVSR
jgi:hypothetical protein